MISLFHLGVMALAVVTLRDKLRGTALAQFIVSRGIGSASLVTGRGCWCVCSTTLIACNT